MLFEITEIIFTMGLTFGVGASTFALAFYIKALEDGVMDNSERAFLRIVFFVLRLGMVSIAAGLAGYLILDYIPEVHAFIAECLLLGIITINALLMEYRLMPMRFGPVLAGGSWYSMFFASQLPLASVPLSTIALCYLGFLLVFYVVFSAIKHRFSPAPKA